MEVLHVNHARVTLTPRRRRADPDTAVMRVRACASRSWTPRFAHTWLAGQLILLRTLPGVLQRTTDRDLVHSSIAPRSGTG